MSISRLPMVRHAKEHPIANPIYWEKICRSILRGEAIALGVSLPEAQANATLPPTEKVMHT